MAILVTGGAGFIGSNFSLEWLKCASEPIVVLDKLTYAGNLSNLASVKDNLLFTFIRGDIGDRALVSSILSKHEIRAVLNFAAESHVDRSIHAPGAFIETNVMGTFELLEAVRGYWQSLDQQKQSEFRFLHVSTDEVYGSLGPSDPAFTETHQYQPNSPYSASKAASDHLVRAYHHTYGIPVLTTNCSNNYGPFHFPEKLIPLMILNALSGKNLPIYGDGKNVRDWLYVTDHCTAIRRVLEAGSPGQTYNIGGCNEKTNLEVVQTICHILDALKPSSSSKSYWEQVQFVKDRPGHDRRYAIDASLIENALGWRPLETFESGIQKTVRWYLENTAWVEGVLSGAYRDWVAKQYDS